MELWFLNLLPSGINISSSRFKSHRQTVHIDEDQLRTVEKTSALSTVTLVLWLERKRRLDLLSFNFFGVGQLQLVRKVIRLRIWMFQQSKNKLHLFYWHNHTQYKGIKIKTPFDFDFYLLEPQLPTFNKTSIFRPPDIKAEYEAPAVVTFRNPSISSYNDLKSQQLILPTWQSLSHDGMGTGILLWGLLWEQ